eukprot:4388592-Pleurochrysis_carterae.AAC.1
MGASPSSNVAQDLANALMLHLLRDMDALEEPRLRRLEVECAAFARWMRTRRSMPRDAYGTQARLHDGLMYTDDSIKLAVGPEGALHLLTAFHRMIGP